MNLFFHAPDRESELSKYYRRAFEKAVELFIVTAYLTEWDTSLKLNSGCHRFRVIIGKDFGITRRAACEAVMHWLPPKRKSQFMVADLISGFHPKAVFWKESNGDCFAIIGSSNLTRAAFETNYEANVFSKIENSEYDAARNWVRSIEKLSVPVSDDWLKCYKEALPTRRSAGKKSKQRHHLAIPLVPLSYRSSRIFVSLERYPSIMSRNASMRVSTPASAVCESSSRIRNGLVPMIHFK